LSHPVRKALLAVQQGHYFLPAEPPRFRVSGLPFCPILFALEAKQPQRSVEFESGFYFNIGHALHNLWQTVGPHSLPDELIGDWQCTRVLQESGNKRTKIIHRCGRVQEFSTFNHAKRAVCPHGKTDCADYLTYKELEFEWHGLTGHTDFLLRDKRGRYHLVDFKTTSNFLFEKPKFAIQQGYYPNQRYLEQLRAYVIMIEAKYNIKVHDYTVAYLSREKALEVGRDKKPALRLFTYLVTDKIRRSQRKRHREYRRRYRSVQRWLENPTRQATRRLYEARPCHTRLEYLNEMAVRFLSNQPCEHHASGACYNGKMEKHLRRLAVK